MEHSQKLLLIQIKEPKASQIRALCKRLDIRPVAVASRDFWKTLGSLAGVKGFAGSFTPEKALLHPAAGAAAPLAANLMPPSEILVFCGMTSDDLDRFLETYRTAGIEPVGLKAVITPANIRWDVPTLCRELLREQAQLR